MKLDDKKRGKRGNNIPPYFCLVKLRSFFKPNKNKKVGEMCSPSTVRSTASQSAEKNTLYFLVRRYHKIHFMEKYARMSLVDNRKKGVD